MTLSETQRTWFKEGHIPWNKGIPDAGFKKGYTPWNKGMKGYTNGGSFRVGVHGEDAGHWKGGITPLTHQIRNSFRYLQWRSDVFTRDDFTCQLCGVRGVYLEADHYLKQFAILLKEYDIKSLEEALACEELWNINNGRTLCKTCHKETDTYLYKGNLS